MLGHLRMKVGLMGGREGTDKLLHLRGTHCVALFRTDVMIDNPLLGHLRIAGSNRVKQLLVECDDIVDASLLMLQAPQDQRADLSIQAGPEFDQPARLGDFDKRAVE